MKKVKGANKNMEEKIYTFEELKNKFGWVTAVATQKERVAYAKKQGLIIEQTNVKVKGNVATFKIIGERKEFTFKELAKKFNWSLSTKTCFNNEASRLEYARARGVIIEPVNSLLDHAKLYIIKEVLHNNEEWQTYPKNDYYEVSKNGLIRLAKNKREVGHINTQGYKYVTFQEKNIPVHRMVLETYQPIENSENFVVDHINGIKTDNRLENLRWLTQRQNTKVRDDNFALLNQNYQKLIEKYGYEGLNQIFQELLKQ